MQKGQLTQCTQQIWVVGTITFSAKRSAHVVSHAVDAVDAVDTMDAVDAVDPVDTVDAVNAVNTVDTVK